MNIKINNEPQGRKLVAVLGSSHGMFLPQKGGGVMFIEKDGTITPTQEGSDSLEECLKNYSNRRPVYEGDVLTLEF